MTAPKPRAVDLINTHDLTIDRLDTIWDRLRSQPLALDRADIDALMGAGMSREDAEVTRDSWLKALSIQDLYNALGDTRRSWER